MTFKAMKFDTGGSPERSFDIQTELFRQGYRWPLGGDKVQYTHVPFLYVDDEGVLTKGDAGCGDYFRRHEAPEYTLQRLKDEAPDAVTQSRSPEKLHDALRIEVLEKQVADLQGLLTVERRLNDTLVSVGVITDDEIAMLKDLIKRGGEL